MFCSVMSDLFHPILSSSIWKAQGGESAVSMISYPEASSVEAQTEIKKVLKRREKSLLTTHFT